MRQSKNPKQQSTLTRFERLTLYTALAASLSAAVLTPAITYYLFDAGSKEYEERGRLVQVDGYGYIDRVEFAKGGPAVAKIDASNTFLNAGRRPLKNLELYVSGSGDPGSRPVPTATGRVLERVRADAKLSIYSVSGTVAPNDQLEIKVLAPHTTWLALRTEFGDTVDLHYPSKWYGATAASAAAQ